MDENKLIEVMKSQLGWYAEEYQKHDAEDLKDWYRQEFKSLAIAYNTLLLNKELNFKHYHFTREIEDYIYSEKNFKKHK